MRVLLAVFTLGALMAATAHVPYEWTHTLSRTCFWSQRPHTRFLGRASPDTEAAAREERCWQGRGSHGANMTPSIKVLLRRWPSSAEMAAWNGPQR